MHLDRRPLSGPTPWEPDQSLGIGPVLLDRVRVTRPRRLAEPEPSGPTLDYNRPPRLLPGRAAQRVQPAAGAATPDKMPVPLLMMLMPCSWAASHLPSPEPVLADFMALACR